jgi:hypothetical protein
MVMAAVSMRTFSSLTPNGIEKDASKKVNDKVARAEALLEKHGVTEAMLKSINPSNAGPNVFVDLGNSIEDNVGFAGEMMAIMQGAGANAKSPSMEWADANVSEIEIDGDSAAGNLKIDGKTQLINFKKVSGGWRVQLPE